MSKKGDARIARALEAEIERERKTARLVERVKAHLPSKGTVRYGADPGSIFHMQMAWHCDAADRADSWSWGQEREWGDQAWANIIEPKLNEFARLKWNEIDRFVTGTGHKAHHNMAVVDIDAEPRARLKELEIQHGDDVFRFRLGNARRLWGFRVVNVFEVLWYDPHHKIYEVDPD